jgi:hypothetical protein
MPSKAASCHLLLIVLQAFEGLANGLEQIPVQFAKIAFDAFENKRQEAFGQMLQRIKAQNDENT